MSLGPQFQQLKMFMSSEEIAPIGSVDSPISIDRHSSSSSRAVNFGKMLNYKADDAEKTGLADSIREHGVADPVQVIHAYKDDGRIIGHGNHRFATMARHDPKGLMPVMHTEGDVGGLSRYAGKYVDVWRSLENYSSAANLVREGMGVGNEVTPTQTPLRINDRPRRT
jgi:hypothetical protein